MLISSPRRVEQCRDTKSQCQETWLYKGKRRKKKARPIMNYPQAATIGTAPRSLQQHATCRAANGRVVDTNSNENEPRRCLNDLTPRNRLESFSASVKQADNYST